jgi:hypothetical protein
MYPDTLKSEFFYIFLFLLLNLRKIDEVLTKAHKIDKMLGITGF